MTPSKNMITTQVGVRNVHVDNHGVIQRSPITTHLDFLEEHKDIKDATGWEFLRQEKVTIVTTVEPFTGGSI